MSGHDNSLGEGELIFELPAPPSIPQECPHKLPTPCRLTSFLTCCVCKDQRLLSETSDTKHLTDLDFVMHGKRHERYCWVCEDYWNDRIEAAMKGLLEMWNLGFPTHAEHREKGFKFLELPAEIRNQIYNIVFEPKIFEIYWLTQGKDLIHRKHSSVASLPSTNFDDQRNHHRDMIRKKSPNITFQRRRWDLPTRLKYKNPITPPFEIPSGPAALLLTCTQIRAETTPVFYGAHAFHFTSRTVFSKFLCLLRQDSKASIRTLHVYYKPQRLDANDTEEWERICQQAAEELTVLEELNITMCLPWQPIPDTPALSEPLDSEKHWARPWLAFRGRGLKRVCISSNLKDPLAEPVKMLRALLLGQEWEQARLLDQSVAKSQV